MVLPHDELGRGPAVVLLHAGIADRRMWTEHLEPLAAAGRRAVAVDLPGFGDAALRPGLQAPWLDVLETMDALAVDRAALVGCSFGGAVALVTAVIARDRVSALVLPPLPPPTSRRPTG
jgi:3-oxoadipate enol-lactonase